MKKAGTFAQTQARCILRSFQPNGASQAAVGLELGSTSPSHCSGVALDGWSDPALCDDDGSMVGS